MFNKIKNYFLCKKYPFLKQTDSNGHTDYTYTWYDDIPIGWQKAFGKQLLKDLKKALIEDNCLKTFEFLQIKEKYGELRLYASGYGEKTNIALTYYEVLSQGYCIDCGRPARYVTKGWLTYYCDNCFLQYMSEKVEKLNVEEAIDKYLKEEAECRLTEKDICTFTTKDLELQEKIDSIDWNKLWDLEESKNGK